MSANHDKIIRGYAIEDGLVESKQFLANQLSMRKILCVSHGTHGITRKRMWTTVLDQYHVACPGANSVFYHTEVICLYHECCVNPNILFEKSALMKICGCVFKQLVPFEVTSKKDTTGYFLPLPVHPACVKT